MDSTRVPVFKKATQLALACLLQSTHGCAPEVQVGFEVLSNFSQAEREVCKFLISENQVAGPDRRSPVPPGEGTLSRAASVARLFPRGCTTGGFGGGMLCTSRGDLLAPFVLLLELSSWRQRWRSERWRHCGGCSRATVLQDVTAGENWVKDMGKRSYCFLQLRVNVLLF